ncbi:MAG: epoxyqueuosine reductase QueH [Candidatus Omnitrophota bacterium]
MKFLLHTCCAPCLIYPFRQLKDKGFEVSGLFYNPNIHPLSEYKNRRQAVQAYAHKEQIEVIYPEYNPVEFFHAINLKEKEGRCLICWELRLRKTAQAARDQGFDYFSTTLLVSPYQDQEALKDIGEKIAQESGVKFYYEDFRPGFRPAHDEARAQGIYCQKYCGCIYSEIEREKSRK